MKGVNASVKLCNFILCCVKLCKCKCENKYIYIILMIMKNSVSVENTLISFYMTMLNNVNVKQCKSVIFT